MSRQHPLPIEALNSDIAILGRKGGGKTVTAKGIAERLVKLKHRVLAIDPLGGWWGLRAAADGMGPGLPVAVFGGEHGDRPLDPALALPLADVLSRENMPTVLDIADMKQTDQRKFLLAFLHELRRVNREPLTIILEEADVFAPQNPQTDLAKDIHDEIDWIARRGRARGFRLITICQRPARLSKDVLTQASTLIAHVLPSPQDRDAVKAWVEGQGNRELAKQVFATLASLRTGEAWTWYADPQDGFLRRIVYPMIETFDSTRTPKSGGRVKEPKALADVDMSAIDSALQKAKEPTAPAKPKADRSEVAAYHAEMRRAEYARGLHDGIERGIAEGRALECKDIFARLSTAAQNAEQVASSILQLRNDAHNRRVEFEKFSASKSNFARQAKPNREIVRPPNDSKSRPASAPIDGFEVRGSGAQRVVNALAFWQALGFDDVSMRHACVVAGMSPKSSTFPGYASAAAKAGWIEYPRPGRLKLTPEGQRHAERPDALQAHPNELRAAALSILRAQPRRVLEYLLDVYPNTRTIEQIAEHLGLSSTSSTPAGYVSEVTSLGLAETVGPGARRAAKWLFPET